MPDTNNLTYRDLKTQLTFCSYKKGVLLPSLPNRLYSLYEQSESDEEKLSRCLTLGEYYYHEKQYDSAKFYLNIVFEAAKNADSKKLAAERMAKLYEMEGRPSEAIKYACFLVPYATENEAKSNLKSQLAELCHEYEQDLQETLHQKQVKKLKRWGELVMVILVTLTLILFILYYVSKKRRRYLKAQKEETEEKLRTTINKHARELEQKDLLLKTAIIEEKQKAQDDLKTREMQHSAAMGKTKSKIAYLQEEIKLLNERNYQGNNEMAQDKGSKEEYEALKLEGLCVNIRQRLKKADSFVSFNVKDFSSLALSSRELSELVQVIDKHCPDFSRRLKRHYPELNSKDIQLCRLYLLNLKVLQVAILLGTDYSSVRKRTNRLKEKIGNEELHLQLKSTFFEAD